MKRAVVTGASSGVGAAIARILSREGYTVVLVGRDHDRLQTLVSELPGPAQAVVADLTDDKRLAEVETILRDRAEPVDLLVNNAAAGWFGPFAAHDPERLTMTVALNVTAVVRLTQAALTAMVPRHSGGVITISSLAGGSPQPGMATYSATKAFVDSWTASVQHELRDTGVRLTAVRPGWVRTDFHARSGQSIDEVGDDEWLAPEAVARRTLDAHAAGEPSVVILPEVQVLKGAIRTTRTWIGRRAPRLGRLRRRLTRLARRPRDQ